MLIGKINLPKKLSLKVLTFLDELGNDVRNLMALITGKEPVAGHLSNILAIREQQSQSRVRVWDNYYGGCSEHHFLRFSEVDVIQRDHFMNFS